MQLPLSVPTVYSNGPLYRVALTKDENPWLWSSPEVNTDDTLVGYASRELALSLALRFGSTYTALGASIVPGVISPRAKVSAHAAVGDPDAFVVGPQRRAMNDLDGIVLAEAEIEGAFADFRNRSAIVAFRDDLESDPGLVDFWDRLNFDGPTDGVTPLLRSVLTLAVIGGSPCAGWVETSGDVDTWNVFVRSIKATRTTSAAHGGESLYLLLAKLAGTMGSPVPVRPTPEIARRLLAASLSADTYRRFADAVDVGEPE